MVRKEHADGTTLKKSILLFRFVYNFRNAFDLSTDFDVIFVGDMFYDDVIGGQVTSLVQRFVDSSNHDEKMVLVGDPG